MLSHLPGGRCPNWTDNVALRGNEMREMTPQRQPQTYLASFKQNAMVSIMKTKVLSHYETWEMLPSNSIVSEQA